MKGIYKNPPAKTLFIDFEVSPHFGGFYDGYETTPISIDRLQWVMSVAFKWFGEDKVYVYGQSDFPLWKKDRFDDTEVVRKAWEAMNKAEIVVAHNAKKFDIKKANTRFLMDDLGPTRPYKVVDTLQVARRYFSFPKNSLNELSKYFEIGGKSEKTHSDLWQKCINGDRGAWKSMKEYNVHDVELLELIYRRMLPFVDPFPVVHPDNGKCRACGGSNFIKRGFRYKKGGQEAQSIQCTGCGKYDHTPYRKPE